MASGVVVGNKEQQQGEEEEDRERPQKSFDIS
jgi:hypothetical protein